MHTGVHIQTKLKDALNIAINMRAEGRYEDALNYMESVRPFFEGEDLYTGRFHCGLGVTYFRMGKHDRAIGEYKIAFSYLAQCDPMEAAAIHTNIADVLIDIDRTDEALEHLEISIDEFSQYEAWKGQTLETKARALLKVGKKQEAYEAAKEAVRILESCDEPMALREAMETKRICFEALHK
jgi:tetratricopeptide (TPR) repeat protein